MRIGVILTVVLVAIAGAYGFFRSTEDTPPDGSSLVTEGRAVYDAHCAACHGAKLEGQPNWKTPNADGSLPAPPHDASGHTWHHPDAVLLRIVRQGGQAAAPPGFVSGMPAFGDKIQEREIRAVLAFIKSTWPGDIRARQEAIDRRASGR